MNTRLRRLGRAVLDWHTPERIMQLATIAGILNLAGLTAVLILMAWKVR